jgi:hypothetical protein
MKVKQDDLLNELIELTSKAILRTKEFKELSLQQLNFKATQSNWSILECIEHLNLYGKFYLPEIESALSVATTTELNNIYKSSFLGDFFVNSIRADNKKKMKATKQMTPQSSELSYSTINIFLKQLEKFNLFLEQSRNRNLVKVKTSISLTKYLKLQLGDTLRFLVYHNDRHIIQAERIFYNLTQNKT